MLVPTLVGLHGGKGCGAVKSISNYVLLNTDLSLALRGRPGSRVAQTVYRAPYLRLRWSQTMLGVWFPLGER